MARLESRLDERINGLESGFDAMEKQFGELRERMAHLEGLLEGLREAVSGRAKAGAFRRAGVMNLVQMSRSLRFFLSIVNGLLPPPGISY